MLRTVGIVLVLFVAIVGFAPQAYAERCYCGYIWELRTLIFFTDGAFNPLPSDLTGNPVLTAILTGGTIKSTNPGQVLVWVEVQHVGGVHATFQSLSVDETLPLDWVISPAWPLSRGAVHVYFVNTTTVYSPDSTSFASSVIPQAFEVTQPSTITTFDGGVHLLIRNFNDTAIGHPLMQYQSILLSVKLNYALKGTNQSASSYPREYIPTASSKGWSGLPFYPGAAAISPGACLGPGTDFFSPSACFFTAYANVVR